MRTFRAIALGLCAALILTIGVAAPANAAISDCQSSETCTFDGTSYENPHYDYNNLLHGCINIGPDWNDRIGSVVNNIPRKVWFYENSGCTGRLIEVAANSTWTAQKQNLNWPNNKFSSLYIFSSA